MFTEDTTEFLIGLNFNNDRTWFNEHRQEYEEDLHRPFKELAEETLAAMQQLYPKENFYLHISRIYRDARRLYGKGPFQDNLWFTIQKGTPQAAGPVFWFEITAFSYSYGMGLWDSTAEFAALWRKRMEEKPEAFRRMIRKLEKPYKLYGYEYKRPKGDLGEELNPWYNRKNISVGYEFEDTGIYEADLNERLLKAFQNLMPLYRYYRKIYELTK